MLLYVQQLNNMQFKRLKIKKNSFYTVVPARSGSKSVKDKNIKFLYGIPLIGYALSISKRIKRSQKTVFSSDSIKYLEIAKKYNPDILHLRSKKNSSDKATDKDFFQEIIKFLSEKNINIPEFFILIRANTPGRVLKELNDAIDKFFENKNSYSSLRSLSEMPETSYKTFEIRNNKLCCICSNSFKVDKANLPRQKYKKTYSANGLVDILKTKNLIKGKTYGEKSFAYVCKNKYIDIDYPSDLGYSKFIMKSKKYYRPR
jgi:CMP-N,N'-diacetyllegionaminic acid synthase